MINDFVNKKVLCTCREWFTAADGKQYIAVWGNLKQIAEIGKTLGFIPNRSHANWFYEIGNMIIMGCQIMYIVSCPEKPNTEKVMNWTVEAGKVIEYEKPSTIYIAE